jgi:hypothetical protein
VTALEVYELSTKGGGTDFARVIATCESLGPYCLIGGLAVNCYVEPVYTLDANIVIIAEHLPALSVRLREGAFVIEAHQHTVNAVSPNSELRIQLTSDRRYQDFPARSSKREVLGILVQMACLEDVVQGKLWAYADPHRRLSKRKKDELDLIRLAESYPALKGRYPADLVNQLGR